MEGTEDVFQPRPLPQTTKIMLLAGGILALIAVASNSALIVLFCLQKLSFYVWKVAAWSTVAAPIALVAHGLLVFVEVALHTLSLVSQRTKSTPIEPPLINFAGAGPSYEYEALGTDRIRMLELLPSDDSQYISCRLHQVSLNSLPQYEALSYTWGTAKPCCAISIDGKKFMIRPNLYNALRVFRPLPAGESRWIWIDALCINQEDESEREEQVLKMGFIYSNSWRLLTWLGGEADDSSWAIAAITGFAKSMDEGEAAICAWEEHFLSVQTFRRTLRAVTALVNRSWFCRSWIVQEYALSYDKTRLCYCGDKQFCLEDFRTGSTRGDIISKIQKRVDRNSDKIRLIRQAPPFYQDLSGMGAGGVDGSNELIRYLKVTVLLFINEKACADLNRGYHLVVRVLALCQTYEKEARKYESGTSEPGSSQKFSGDAPMKRNEQLTVKHTLQTQLAHLRHMRATDPKDKVYSILGLFQNPKRDFRLDSHDLNLLVVKYSESVAKVYASLVRAIVVPTRRLEILQECRRLRTNDLPSWVPDWRTDNSLVIGVTNYNASSKTDAQFSFSEDLSVMTVKGFVWDKLRISCGKPLFKWTELKYGKLKYGYTMVFVSWVMVVVQLSFSIELTIKRLLILLRFIGSEQQIFENNIKTQALFRVKRVTKCLGSDQLFIQTPREYFGRLSNPNFGDGDLVCILLGCSWPMVLRKMSDHYELQGQIYIEGIMHGEAMACLETGECNLQNFELH
jgi:hypothetical protein